MIKLTMMAAILLHNVVVEYLQDGYESHMFPKHLDQYREGDN